MTCPVEPKHAICYGRFLQLAKLGLATPEKRVKCPGIGCSVLFSASRFRFLGEKTRDGKKNALYEPSMYKPSMYKHLQHREERDGILQANKGFEACAFCDYIEDYGEFLDKQALLVFRCRG